MAGTNTSDSETIPQNFQKNGVSKVIGNIGRGAAGLALGLGMVAGSPSPVEAQIRNDDKYKPACERKARKLLFPVFFDF